MRPIQRAWHNVEHLRGRITELIRKALLTLAQGKIYLLCHLCTDRNVPPMSHVRYTMFMSYFTQHEGHKKLNQ